MRITDYGPLAAAASNDQMPVVDVDDLTQSAAGTTKRIAVSDLLAGVTGGGGASLAIAGTLATADPNPAAAGTLYPCDTSGASFNLTLPDSPPDGTLIGVKLVRQAGTNGVTIRRSTAGGSADVFNVAGGVTSLPPVAVPGEVVVLQYSAAGHIWYVTADTLPLSQADARYMAAGAMPTAVYVPSDPSGATDMTAELQAFRLVNPGRLVKVADGSVIKLKNCFQGVTTGDILLDFSNATIVYDHGTSADYAILCDNTANATAPEVGVSSLAMATVSTDATVTQVTLASALAASRFDWVALYSTDANPAISGGQYGEIFQLLDVDTPGAATVLTATRRLNNHAFYSANIKVRKLDASRRVYIRGGIIRANGNTEDHSIITRAGGILVQGFADPLVESVTFDRPWSYCLRFQCNAAPRARDITVRDVGNLAAFNGFTYGVLLYAMNDCGDVRNLVVRNGRHAGFTTDGQSGTPTATWYAKGIPTNLAVTGVHGYNCHASVIDTHEEGDGIVIDGAADFYPYQDADISGGFTGLGAQIRASNVTLRNFTVYGVTRGIKVPAVEHGFEDQVTLENICIMNTTQGATTDSDTGLRIDDEDSVTAPWMIHKRHVYFDGTMNNAGVCFSVGKTAKLTIRSVSLRRFDTAMDAGAGAQVTFTGHAEFDYRNDPRTASYNGILCRSDATFGGCSVVFLQRPKIIKGTDNSPLYLLTESDTTASKLICVPGLAQYNPSAVTSTLITNPAATTFAAAAVTDTSVTPFAPLAGGTAPTGAQLQATAGFSVAGTVLTSGGSGVLPSWLAPAASAGGSGAVADDAGGLWQPVASVSGVLSTLPVVQDEALNAIFEESGVTLI